MRGAGDESFLLSGQEGSTGCRERYDASPTLPARIHAAKIQVLRQTYGEASVLAGLRLAPLPREASHQVPLHSILGADDLTPTQQAYALLWLSPQADELTNTARGILRDALSLEERQQAVQWGMNNTRRTPEGIEMGSPE